MSDLEKYIRTETLKNAYRYKGAANQKAIMGRVMKNFEEARKDKKRT